MATLARKHMELIQLSEFSISQAYDSNKFILLPLES